ncbi:GIY-YIG nuclease family protein [Pseudomonas sp. 10S4]|uniref:GIY-YIG nuclease family protein n=1 Tax=Pseudomonas sp. 10S4 TaxID=3048583 RepID=UPI002AC8C823|nr:MULTISPECIES: GIY-YIG nuclease family protein [unclassified Pseudomonas]MEB0228586.1 GIY-YIG nuclease family protein [Pseudomonas sp. 5S1]MEB0297518.1 GIY-YIG nuclease family protein [Pseudomonas sp. 10S4]WPX17455.1 GIY-YIG nuclease family protein [Pseudomonas sp. 10S4]
MEEYYVTGYVYFIQAGDDLAIKIGSKIEPLAKRILKLQTANHLKLRLVGAIDLRKLTGLDTLGRVEFSILAKRKEAEIQARFSGARIHGEWFNITNDLVNYIEQVSNVN